MTRARPGPDNAEPVAAPKGRGLGRIVRATGYSLAGLRAAFQNEVAFRQEIAMTAVLTPLAFFVGRDAVEISLLVGALLLVLIVELLNSAIETIVDRVGLEHHDLSGRAKDMGSAAVMLSLGFMSLVWALILFAPRP